MIPSFILKSSIRLDRLFKAYAKKTALITQSGVWTFNDVRQCLRTVIFNLESAGVRKGHRVAFHGENSELHLYLFLASWVMGFLYIPLDFKSPLKRLIRGQDIDFLIMAEEAAEIGRADHPIVLGPEAIMQCLLPFPDSFTWPAISFQQEASVIFTSGSTGKPKGLVHTVGNYVFSALGTNEFIGLSRSDRWLVSLPLFHVGGVLIWVRTLLSGGASILPASLKAIDEAIKVHQPSVLSLVPAQLIRLLDNHEMAAILRSCRVILLGGAPPPAWLIEKALDLGIPVMPTYGSTEACAQITGVALNDPRSAYRTAGRPVPYREVRIDDDGSILLGGKTIFKRYLTDEKSRHTRKDGFFKTADAGCLDDNGNLVCLGRTDGVFISGGENIHPFEIENHLLALEDVSAAFVVPVPHREFGKVPWAFVETSAAFDEGLVIAGLKKHLPGYKVPKRIIRLDPDEKKGKLKFSRDDLTALAGKMIQNRR
ncbi:MAG: 2-succinylbenzoate--CoA ligase [Syntrophus sp. SKADARSKE-3]|nr:2-succinylbenzoate--CoA ligase [Syntrophus sp. SKADARSKE-3]